MVLGDNRYCYDQPEKSSIQDIRIDKKEYHLKKEIKCVFQACYHCIQVYTEEEGHRCEDKVKSADALVRNEPENSMKDSVSSVEKDKILKGDIVNKQWNQQRKKSTKENCMLDSGTVIEKLRKKKVENEKLESDRKTSDMEYRKTNKHVRRIKDETKTENFNNFHPLAPNPRNASAEFDMSSAFPKDVTYYSSQSTQPEINKYDSTPVTNIAEHSAIPQQAVPSTRQPTWNNQDSYTVQFLAVATSSVSSTGFLC